jgi:hypothetical protein
MMREQHEDHDMSEFNRPDRHRLSRVHKRIEKALDFLAQAHGEMRPAKFRWIKGELDQVMATLDTLQHQLANEVGSGDTQLPLDQPETSDDADARPRKRAAA